MKQQLIEADRKGNMAIKISTKNHEQGTLTWPLGSDPGPWRSLIYGLQWLAFGAANIAVIPVILGPYLGLDQAGIAEYAQRMFLYIGIGSFIQIYFGHRLPVIEGPAAQWWVITISISGIAVAIGKPYEVLRTDLVGAMLLCGLVLVLLGFIGLIGRVIKMFTPAVNGCVLILLCLQLSGTLINGIVGENLPGERFNYLPVLIALIVIALVVFLQMKNLAFLKSISILIGLAVGWLLYAVFSNESAKPVQTDKIFELPGFFAWGWPTFDPGIAVSGILVSFILLANLLASLQAMSGAAGIAIEQKNFDKGVIFSGISNLLSGIGASVGTVPFSASSGLVKMSGVAAKKPFVIFSLMMIGASFFPQVGALLASIPQAVGYAVLLAAFTQLLIIGLEEIKKLKLDQRDSFVIGLTVLVGAGIAALPDTALAALPDLARYIFGNALIVGIVICILMEHVFLPRK